MLRERPVRPNLYLPVVNRLGVNDRDQTYINIVSFGLFVVSFMLDLKWGLVPVPILLGLGTFLLLVLFFNYTRRGRRPFWLEHHVRALRVPLRQRRFLRSDARPPFLFPNGK